MRRAKGIFLFFSVMGPGLITAMIDNDASGITTYSVAGARFGYTLLWTLIPTTVALIVIQEMIARMGVVTGKGLSGLIRENFGVKTTFYMMLGLFFANLGTTVANFAGWAASMEILGFNRYFIVPAGALAIWFLVAKGSYRIVEKILLGACVIYFGYIVSGLMAKPDWGAVLKNTFVPSISLEPEYIMLAIAIIGTTITPWMQFYLQSSIAEKGIQIEKYGFSKAEIFMGSSVTDIGEQCYGHYLFFHHCDMRYDSLSGWPEDTGSIRGGCCTYTVCRGTRISDLRDQPRERLVSGGDHSTAGNGLLHL